MPTDFKLRPTTAQRKWPLICEYVLKCISNLQEMYVEAERNIGKIWRRIRLVRIPKSFNMLNSNFTLLGPLHRVI